MREAIAAAMSRSKREIPHYYLSLTTDVTAAVDWLAARNASVPVTERLLFAALLIKAVALSCRDFKGFSGFYRDGRYEESPSVHVGVAVAIRGGGLVAPAIMDTRRQAAAGADGGVPAAGHEGARRDGCGQASSRRRASSLTSLGDVGGGRRVPDHPAAAGRDRRRGSGRGRGPGSSTAGSSRAR